MFQKPNPLFALNALNIWQTLQAITMESCYVVMAWKLKEDPRKGKVAYY